MADGTNVRVIATFQEATLASVHTPEGRRVGLHMSIGYVDRIMCIAPSVDELGGRAPFAQLQIHHLHGDRSFSACVGFVRDPDLLRAFAKELRRAANVIELATWQQAHPGAELPQGVDARG